MTYFFPLSKNDHWIHKVFLFKLEEKGSRLLRLYCDRFASSLFDVIYYFHDHNHCHCDHCWYYTFFTIILQLQYHYCKPRLSWTVKNCKDSNLQLSHIRMFSYNLKTFERKHVFSFLSYIYSVPSFPYMYARTCAHFDSYFSSLDSILFCIYFLCCTYRIRTSQQGLLFLEGYALSVSKIRFSVLKKSRLSTLVLIRIWTYALCMDFLFIFLSSESLKKKRFWRWCLGCMLRRPWQRQHMRTVLHLFRSYNPSE